MGYQDEPIEIPVGVEHESQVSQDAHAILVNKAESALKAWPFSLMAKELQTGHFFGAFCVSTKIFANSLPQLSHL